jgi:AraC-like DNA-binding protein
MTIDAHEKISVHRRLDLPGVELRSVQNSGRLWRHFCTGFELLLPETWEGDVVYRQAQHRVSPGMVLCAEPGHAFRVLHVERAGTINALSVDLDTYTALLAQRAARDTPATGPVLALTRSLASTGTLLLKGLRDPSGPLERLCELLAELLAPLVPERTAQVSDSSRIRDLRSFKRQFGLTPHAYDLCKRIALAKEALRSGAKPSHVAHTFGFVDQSHLTRHFKRLVGITPFQYSRAGRLPTDDGGTPAPSEA